ncbi:MAG: hypothetical protein HKL85_03220 [Acidimicrobiaceae bacterium]|nr:hypothetical protein [Acidimicrobiaceae bacterium]
MQTPATPTTATLLVTPRREVLRHLVVASTPALAIYTASRIMVVVTLALVAKVRHHALGHYLMRWDSRWYIQIARHGYVHSIPRGHGSVAQVNLGFFPLLPMLMRVTHWITRLGFAASGEVATFFIGAVAAVVVWWLVRDHYGEKVATRATALVFFSPAAVVFSFVYSEGLIIALASITLLALHRHRWILAGIAAALATACDPVASAIVAPCAVAAYSAWRSDRDARAWWAPALAPVGIGLFFLYLWIHTGSPLSWYLAQRAGWQAGPMGTGVFYAIYRLFTSGVHDLNSLVKTSAFIATIGIVVLWRRVRPPLTWSVYAGAVLVFGFLSPIVGISPRLMLRGFPLFAIVAAGVTRRRFVAIWVLSALAMCALSVASTSIAWTP